MPLWPPLTLGQGQNTTRRKQKRLKVTISHPGARPPGATRSRYDSFVHLIDCCNLCVFVVCMSVLGYSGSPCTPFRWFWGRCSTCSSWFHIWSLFFPQPVTPTILTTSLRIVPSTVEVVNRCADQHLSFGSVEISGVWMTRSWHLYVLVDIFTLSSVDGFPADPDTTVCVQTSVLSLTHLPWRTQKCF